MICSGIINPVPNALHGEDILLCKSVHSRHYIRTLHREGSMILAGGGVNLSNIYTT